MTEPTDGFDLPTVLRGLRRRADLSQRELAARAGVPKTTVARIESGRGADPGFRTVARLVRAAGGELAIGVPEERVCRAERACRLAPVPAVPHDDLRDGADRRYPAHLDVRAVRTLKDWPGAWWAYWYDLPPERWPLPVPPATYDLDRGYREDRRWRERIRAQVRCRRVTSGLPDTSWRFLAELPDGASVGELRAHERSVDLLLGHEVRDERELVLDGVLVAPELRGLGIGRRLVDLLAEEMDRAGITTAYAVGEAVGTTFLLACGFRMEASRPAALSLRRAPPG